MNINQIDRKNIFKDVKTIVVKIGTAMLTDPLTNILSKKRIKNFTTQISALKKNGYNIIIVSSGAVLEGWLYGWQCQLVGSILW